MSTPSPRTRMQQWVSEPPAGHALTLVTDDHARQMVPPPPARPTNVHRFFFGVGYGGLALVWAALWLSAYAGNVFEFLGAFGALFIGLGGVGILLHTVVKPSERKVRHLLLALASLVVTAIAAPVVGRVAREAYAAGAVNRLQPLADDLVRDGRIREIGSVNGAIQLNGFNGPGQGPGEVSGFSGSPELAHVLAHHGISRGELDAFRERLEDAGMVKAERTDAGWVFYPDGPNGFAMLYLPPGSALPPAHGLVEDHGRWHSQPLGGGWFLLLH